MYKHLIVFDDECSFCKNWIKWVLVHDSKKQFVFTSFRGQTIKAFLPLIDQKDLGKSVILIEYFETKPKVFLFGKAVLQILWLIGGVYKLFGAFWILPKWMIDKIYLVASQRRKLYENEQDTFFFKDRFLP